jgi:flagellar hook-basal body complex protein FliE
MSLQETANFARLNSGRPTPDVLAVNGEKNENTNCLRRIDSFGGVLKTSSRDINNKQRRF